MTEVFVVPEPLLQTPSIVYEPRQIQVVKYGDHCRAMCELEARVDRAYTQRNNAAVALVRMALLLGWPAGRGLDDKTGQHVVYLDLPNGEQVSYHMAPADVQLLDGLPEYTGKWDGKFTGTTAWAEMVPGVPQPDEDGLVWSALYEQGTDHAAQVIEDPSLNACGMCHQGAEGVSVGGFTFGPDTNTYLLLENPPWRDPVPKAPFPPGVCACPKCEQPRAAGKLFCRPHRHSYSRVADLEPLTNERLAYMMQRDGEQQ